MKDDERDGRRSEMGVRVSEAVVAVLISMGIAVFVLWWLTTVFG